MFHDERFSNMTLNEEKLFLVLMVIKLINIFIN